MLSRQSIPSHSLSKILFDSLTMLMHEAKTHLSRLVDEAAAGQSFVICKAGKPMVRVTPLNQSDEAAPVRSRLGMLRGQLSVPDDFDRMGQEEIADLFEGIGER